MLSRFWANAEQMLNKCWANTEKMLSKLGKCWANAKQILSKRMYFFAKFNLNALKLHNKMQFKHLFGGSSNKENNKTNWTQALLLFVWQEEWKVIAFPYTDNTLVANWDFAEIIHPYNWEQNRRPP